MAQKSLPILNKVNTSMVWYTTFYFNHYKWLSSQNLYLLYFFNKLFVYLDFLFLELVWVKPYKTNLYHTKTKTKPQQISKIRFFKPLTSYLVNVKEVYVIFNLYYKTTLEAFQKVTAMLVKNLEDEIIVQTPVKKLQNVYFRSWKRKFRS